MENKNNPLLSVIIPVYNVELYIDRCIKSVLSQDYDNLEIILVDDGSTDNSGKICDQCAGMDTRIVVVHKKNGGIVSARKAGLEVATGEYATYVDSDDWIEQSMYSELMDLMLGADAEIVTSGCIRDYGNHIVVDTEEIEKGIYENETLKRIKNNIIDTDSFFKSIISIHVYNKIYKYSLLKRHQMEIPNEINIGEDAACVYPVFLDSTKVVVSGESYYHYCIRGNSTMGTYCAEERKQYEILFNYLQQKFLDSHIKNAKRQFDCLKKYYLLLRYPEEVLSIRNGLFIPFGDIGNECKIVLYGNGKFGRMLYTYLEGQENYNVVAVVDECENEETISLDNLSEYNYDVVLVAVLVNDVIKEIKDKLENHGIKNILSVNPDLL